MDRFPHVPREAVLKEDLLRTGIAFDPSALSDNLDGEVKPKSYFIFSFDQKPLAELGEAATRRPPEEIALTGGHGGLRRTIVSVRVNPASPWRVTPEGLELEGRPVADVEFPPMPAYYRHVLSNGKTVMETAPTSRHADAHVARSSQSQGGTPEQEPTLTRTRRVMSRAVTRRPVLPVLPSTSVAFMPCALCITASSAYQPPQRSDVPGPTLHALTAAGSPISSSSMRYAALAHP